MKRLLFMHEVINPYEFKKALQLYCFFFFFTFIEQGFSGRM